MIPRLLFSTDWNPVVPAIVGVVVQVPTLVLVWLSRKETKTGGGTTLAQQVQETRQFAEEAKEHAEHVAQVVDEQNGPAAATPGG